VLRSESFCVVLGGRIEQERTRGRQSATTTDWMKSNDMECKHTGWLIKSPKLCDGAVLLNNRIQTKGNNIF